MGVPKFFRYISERYPCLSQLVKEDEIPEFDNLYLDMNGIIHVCSHPNDFDPHFRISEETIFQSIFHYIEILFHMIKPQKLFFMAIDGVAPRAKMNQQRGRRFRTVKEMEEMERRAKDKGEVLPGQARFDSNCITPGTVFMDNLHQQLKYFVTNKITNDPLWQKCTVILSGHQTPGEGEHKIMDYIRYLKTQPDYDPNTRHCLYGLDADLLMLGLCTHEPNFCLLREEIKYGKKNQKRIITPEETNFYLLHISLLREYLDLEFQIVKDMISFNYDIESIIDDWVLMGFLVGNDFIPHLPDVHINKNGLEMLHSAYKEVLPKLDGYLHENGYLNLQRFKKYLERLSELDLERFEETYADIKFFEEKTGRKQGNFDSKRPSELNELIDNTMVELGLESEELTEEDDNTSDKTSEDDTFLSEFSQHKTNYYKNKLELENVDEEVLQKQAEGYIQAIQWNLHYYYHGCASWSWFYPHHYSPFVSDVANFKDIDLNFSKGEPFLPFHQLLAVLPPASKNLLPEAYQWLMVSEKSPIIDFYPPDFSTDLNGKLQEWEAVVLIPFIQELRLLSAMEECSDALSQDEIRRNRHGPMSLYSYTSENLGSYSAPNYFPELSANHALEKTVWPDDIAVDPTKLKFGLRPGIYRDFYVPGFPALRFITHTARLKKQGCKVFDQPSRGLNMILKINDKQNEENKSVRQIAQEYLGSSVFINWPHIVEAKVTKVVFGDTKYSIINEKLVKEKLESDVFKHTASAVASENLEKKGIEVGDITILIYASRIEGRKFFISDAGSVILEKKWEKSDCPYAFQTVLKDIPILPSKKKIPETIEELFPIDCIVFTLTNDHYGSMGTVVDNKNKISVKLTYQNDLYIDKEKYLSISSNDVSIQGHVAARRLHMNYPTFAKITSALFLVDSSGRKHNVGLNLKSNKKNQEVPGYTRRENTSWLYSIKTLDLVEKYRNQFPNLFSFVDSASNDYDYPLDKIYPGSLGKEKLDEIKEWLKKQEHADITPIDCESEFLSERVVADIEKDIDNFAIFNSQLTVTVMPKLLHKSDSSFGTTPPEAKNHYLMDRIICCRPSHTVPIGSLGLIIGISTSTKPSNFIYIILFDKPFVGGMSLLGSSPNRAYRLSSTSFINISDGMRRFSVSKPTSMTLQSNITSNFNRQPSAFASVIRPPTSQDHFQKFLAMSKELEQRKHEAKSSYIPPPYSFQPQSPYRSTTPRPTLPFCPPPFTLNQLQNPYVPTPPFSQSLTYDTLYLQNHSYPHLPLNQPLRPTYGSNPPFNQKPPFPQHSPVKPVVDGNFLLNVQNSPLKPHLPQKEPFLPPQSHNIPMSTKLGDSDYTKAQSLMEVLKIKPEQKSLPSLNINEPHKTTSIDSQSAALAEALKMDQEEDKKISPNNCMKLLSYYERKNSGMPKYEARQLDNGLLMAQVVLPTGEIFYGLPSSNKETAYDNAAFEALKSLPPSPPKTVQTVPLHQPQEFTSKRHLAPQPPAPPLSWQTNQNEPGVQHQLNGPLVFNNSKFNKPFMDMPVRFRTPIPPQFSKSKQEFVPLQVSRRVNSTESKKKEIETKEVSTEESTSPKQPTNSSQTNATNLETSKPAPRQPRKSRIAANLNWDN